MDNELLISLLFLHLQFLVKAKKCTKRKLCFLRPKFSIAGRLYLEVSQKYQEQGKDKINEKAIMFNCS